MPSTVRLPQTDFAMGELDPLMFAREDVKAYKKGAAKVRNFALQANGGVTRRPGSTHVATLQTSVRLFPFVFNDTQQYVFVFSDQRVDIYTVAGVLAQSSLGQAWTEAMLDTMNVTQKGDVMFVCHEDLPTQEIKRTGATTFTIGLYVFESNDAGDTMYQPYYKFATGTTTMAASATTGSVTLTLSAAHWNTNHVGDIVRYKGDELLITAFTDTTHVTATVRTTLSATAADSDWDEPVSSVNNGYFKTVMFFVDRLWFGGSKALPSNVFASRIGAFYNFDVGTGLDDESIQAGIGASSVNEIRGMLGLRDLLIFTDHGEFYVPQSTSTPITPATFEFKQQTPYGCSYVQPVAFDGAALYVQRTSNSIREFLYSDTVAAYTSNTASLLANHLINTPVDMSVISGTINAPEQYAIVVNSDGTAAIFHSIRDEKVAGWTLWDTDGHYKRAVAVGDNVFFAVERTTTTNPWTSDFSEDFGATGTAVYLEKLDGTVTLDNVVSASAVSPTTTFSGFSAHSGKEVSVVSGNLFMGMFTVTGGGEITVNDPVTAIDAGFSYTPILQTMPAIVALSKAGAFMGEWKRMVSAVVILNESVNMEVNGANLLIRNVDDDFSQEPTALTGMREFALSGYSRQAQVTLTQDAPLPLTVLGIQVSVQVST
jgi:hypothetical protein